MEQVAEATAGGVGAVASVLTTYPLTTTKIRLQAQRKKKPIASGTLNAVACDDSDAGVSGTMKRKNEDTGRQSDNNRPYTGAWDCICRTGREQGLAGFFSGIESAIFKG
jgi:hypothetical protein